MTSPVLPPLLRVPTDIRDYLFNFVDAKSLQSLRFTSGKADEMVAPYWQARVDRHLSRFVQDVPSLLQHMDACRAVISGSSALAVIYREEWTPQDLDLYAPVHTAHFLVYYLVHHEGYTCLPPPHAQEYGSYGAWEAIASVSRLRRGTSSIDVIQACMPSALYPIIGFWATPLINYISARGFTTTYYDLTLSKRALLCPLRLLDYSVPNERTVSLIAKYKSRGYDFRLSGLAWAREMDADAECPGGGSAACPTTLRYLGDEHCVVGSLRFVRSLPLAAADFYNVCTTVGWIRGGWMCGGRCSLRSDSVPPLVFPHRIVLTVL